MAVKRTIGRPRFHKPRFLPKPTWAGVTHKQGPKGQMTDLQADPNEARAVPYGYGPGQVRGTLPERILYKELQKRKIPFEFQSSVDGGKQRLGGSIIDFVLTDRRMMIEVKGTYWHTQVHTAAEDKARTVRLLQTYQLVELWDWEVYSPFLLDEWFRRNIDLGLPDRGHVVMSGTREPEDMADKQLRREFEELKATVESLRGMLLSGAPGTTLQIADANIANVSADKITAGRLDAFVELGTDGTFRAGDTVGHGVTITQDVIRMAGDNNTPFFFVDGANEYLQIGRSQWEGGSPLIYDRGVLTLPGTVIAPGSVTMDRLDVESYASIAHLLAPEIMTYGLTAADPDDATDKLVLDSDGLTIYADDVPEVELSPGTGLIFRTRDLLGNDLGSIRNTSLGTLYDYDGNGWMRGYHKATTVSDYPDFDDTRYWDYRLTTVSDNTRYKFAVEPMSGNVTTGSNNTQVRFMFGDDELTAESLLSDMPNLGFRWTSTNYAWRIDGYEAVVWARTPDQFPFLFNGQVGAADEVIHPYGDANFDGLELRSGGYVVAVRVYVGTADATAPTKFNIFNGATLIGTMILATNGTRALWDPGQAFWEAEYTETLPVAFDGASVPYTGDPCQLKVETDYGAPYTGRPSNVQVVVVVASGAHK